MKIVKVEVGRLVISAQAPPFDWRRGLPGSEPELIGGILRIGTDAGVEGIAVTRRGLVLEDLVERRLRSELLGADPLARERIWHRFWELDRIEELPLYSLGLADMALWDLAGKAFGGPTHQLLGAYRDTIPAYGSTTTFASVEEYLDVAQQCLELGFSAIKLPAWGDAREDARLAEAVRSNVGDTVDLMFDGSAAFDLGDDVYLGRALSGAGFRWYEEPMREFSITAYRWLSERTEIPLLVAETSDGAHINTADFIASGCATYVRTSAALRGGFTAAMRIAHTADSFRLRGEVDGGGPASAHLCMAIPNTTYYESLVTSNPVVRELLVDSQLLVRAPSGPGVGFPQEGITVPT